MQSSSTAILHLHRQVPHPDWVLLEAFLRGHHGVEQVSSDPDDWVVVVRFDVRRTSLAALVRYLEDHELRVEGVAERPRWSEAAADLPTVPGGV